jgi:SAM-dependent methyltransferase
MSNADSDSSVLDVGCGVTPNGTVNVDFIRRGENLHVGAFMNPHVIPNFVVADACYLPFKDGAFDLVFSSHVIEHVPDPKKMFGELCRVTGRRVIVRCPHKRGSGAKRPHHINYIDEEWFRKAAESIGVAHRERITIYDFPVSNRLPNKIIVKVNKGQIWRVLRHAEWLISRKLHIAFEFECQVKKSLTLPYISDSLLESNSIKQLAMQ